jgi:hypothetical protein
MYYDSFDSSWKKTDIVFVDDINDIVGIGTNAPNTSSILDLSSTSKGLLVPRVTTTQKNAIISPAIGLIVMDTTLDIPMYYADNNGSPEWRNFIGSDSIVQNSLFVSQTNPNATDTRTGLSKYNLFKPFATIEAALSAATTGDTIVLLSDCTISDNGGVVNNLFKNGVTLTDLGIGYTITYSGAGTGAMYSAVGSNNTCIVTGKLSFINESTVADANAIMIVGAANVTIKIDINECSGFDFPVRLGNSAIGALYCINNSYFNIQLCKFNSATPPNGSKCFSINNAYFFNLNFDTILGDKTTSGKTVTALYRFFSTCNIIGNYLEGAFDDAGASSGEIVEIKSTIKTTGTNNHITIWGQFSKILYKIDKIYTTVGTSVTFSGVHNFNFDEIINISTSDLFFVVGSNAAPTTGEGLRLNGNRVESTNGRVLSTLATDNNKDIFFNIDKIIGTTESGVIESNALAIHVQSVFQFKAGCVIQNRGITTNASGINMTVNYYSQDWIVCLGDLAIILTNSSAPPIKANNKTNIPVLIKGNLITNGTYEANTSPLCKSVINALAVGADFTAGVNVIVTVWTNVDSVGLSTPGYICTGVLATDLAAIVVQINALATETYEGYDTGIIASVVGSTIEIVNNANATSSNLGDGFVVAVNAPNNDITTNRVNTTYEVKDYYLNGTGVNQIPTQIAITSILNKYLPA